MSAVCAEEIVRGSEVVRRGEVGSEVSGGERGGEGQ